MASKMDTTCYKCTDDLDLDLKEWEEAYNMNDHTLLVNIYLMFKDFRHSYVHERIEDRYDYILPLMKFLECKK